MNAESAIPKRLPPSNLDAERAVLSGILLRNDVLNSVLDIVHKEDFYKETHQIIFEGMSEIIDKGFSVDLLTLRDHFEKKGLLEKVGGPAAIAALMDGVSAVSNIDYYAKIVKDKSILRRLIKKTEEISFRAYQSDGEVSDLVEEAEAGIFEIAQTGESRGPHKLKDILDITFENLAQLSQRPSLITGIPTGFKELDEMTSGLHSGELVIIAARPSMGKTTFGLNMAHHIGVRENSPVLIFSLEMTEEQLVRRMLCTEAEVDAQRLRTGMVRREEWTRLASAAATLSRAPIFIDDTPALSLLDMRSRARRIKAKSDLKLIMVDYLQLMQGRKSQYESRQLEISEISRSLKFMAKELDVPVVALSQLSRAVESRTGNRPQLSDLRESGSIEQDADVVAFIYRPEYYRIQEIEIKGQRHSSEGIAEIIIAKQRNGPIGSVHLVFRKHLLQFLEMMEDASAPDFTSDQDSE